MAEAVEGGSGSRRSLTRLLHRRAGPGLGLDPLQGLVHACCACVAAPACPRRGRCLWGLGRVRGGNYPQASPRVQHPRVGRSSREGGADGLTPVEGAGTSAANVW